LVYTRSVCLRLYSFNSVLNNKGWISTTAGGILRTTDSGANWSWQSAGVNLIGDLHFINTFYGWGVSDNSSVIKTMNGGWSWSVNPSEMGLNLNSVFFINYNTGWAVGDSGLIIKTTNGGN
jgi:photosystem II stability/assembly factor-like uncharacterized protein